MISKSGYWTKGVLGSPLRGFLWYYRPHFYAFTPRAFFNAYIQYNADTHLVSSNIRFNWTHHPLSDLYIVYNDTRNTLTGQLRERAFIVKLTNLFSF